MNSNFKLSDFYSCSSYDVGIPAIQKVSSRILPAVNPVSVSASATGTGSSNSSCISIDEYKVYIQPCLLGRRKDALTGKVSDVIERLPVEPHCFTLRAEAVVPKVKDEDKELRKKAKVLMPNTAKLNGQLHPSQAASMASSNINNQLRPPSEKKLKVLRPVVFESSSSSSTPPPVTTQPQLPSVPIPKSQETPKTTTTTTPLTTTPTNTNTTTLLRLSNGQLIPIPTSALQSIRGSNINGQQQQIIVLRGEAPPRTVTTTPVIKQDLTPGIRLQQQQQQPTRIVINNPTSSPSVFFPRAQQQQPQQQQQQPVIQRMIRIRANLGPSSSATPPTTAPPPPLPVLSNGKNWTSSAVKLSQQLECITKPLEKTSKIEGEKGSSQQQGSSQQPLIYIKSELKPDADGDASIFFSNKETEMEEGSLLSEVLMGISRTPPPPTHAMTTPQDRLAAMKKKAIESRRRQKKMRKLMRPPRLRPPLALRVEMNSPLEKERRPSVGSFEFFVDEALPKGWFVQQRKSLSDVSDDVISDVSNMVDLYFYTPQNYKLRSQREILKFLEFKRLPPRAKMAKFKRPPMAIEDMPRMSVLKIQMAKKRRQKKKRT